jgi:hypothetical protein
MSVSTEPEDGVRLALPGKGKSLEPGEGKSLEAEEATPFRAQFGCLATRATSDARIGISPSTPIASLAFASSAKAGKPH